ncbi:MAG: IS1380 family transposase [Nocardioidaceae bacterium]
MQLKHEGARTHQAFDEQHVVASAGLVPVMGLAQRCGLDRLVADRVKIGSSARPQVKGNPGVNPAGKITSVVAGMAAGADSIDDMELVRAGGMGRVFGGVYAPSSLGSHLRAYDWGNACQLEQASRGLVGELVAHSPALSGADRVCYVDVDDMRRRVFGHAKEGVGFGVCKVGGYQVKLRNLNPLLGTISTPTSAPLVATTRLRGGKAGSARGAASFVTETINVARSAGADGLAIVRADSAFYNHKVVDACQRAGARFSITAPADAAVQRAIAGIAASAWTPIKYPQAVFDEQAGQWISDAEVAECSFTAFASTDQPVSARLIVRRVRARNELAAAGQDELMPAWRYHAIFTDSPMPLLEAETCHRAHAIIEQQNADLIDGPLAHLPSGSFAANAAWLSCAAMCHNLLRAAGALASTFHAKARGATIRRQLINIPARLARKGRGHIRLHLPDAWPWQTAWTTLFNAACRPAAPA